MSIHIDARGLFTKLGLSNTVSQKQVSSGSEISIQNSLNNKKGKSIRGSFSLQQVKNTNKKKMSPEVIARKIAQGKGASKEEVDFLKENFPELYRKAMRANRIRENLEEALKSAKSETAKASAVAEATSQASFLSAADASNGEGNASSVGAGLYSDAIQAALQKYGSKKLNKEMDTFINSKQDTCQDEEANANLDEMLQEVKEQEE